MIPLVFACQDYPMTRHKAKISQTHFGSTRRNHRHRLKLLAHLLLWDFSMIMRLDLLQEVVIYEFYQLTVPWQELLNRLHVPFLKIFVVQRIEGTARSVVAIFPCIFPGELVLI